jgi:hypothetical protein
MMKVKANTGDLIVIEYQTQNDVLDKWLDNIYVVGQEVVLKKLIYPDHEEWHTAEIKRFMANTDASYFAIKTHIRKFYDPDSIAMNETLKLIKQGGTY